MRKFGGREVGSSRGVVSVESLEGRLVMSAGDLDPTFGAAGKTTTDFAAAPDQLTALVIQPDGKIVAAGASSDGGQPAKQLLSLARYNTDGSLDTSFSGDGKATTLIPGGDVTVTDLAVQADGKIVAVCEVSTSGGVGAAIVRYLPDGSPDGAFGLGGILSSSSAAGRAIALQTDGKIIVAGQNTGDFISARYKPDSTLDFSYGVGGTSVTDVAGGADGAVSMILQPDGKIVMCGFATTATGADWALLRYNANGTLDSTFGSGGKVTADFFGRDDFAVDAAVQPGGRIVVVGSAQQADGTVVPVMMRFNADGSADPTFGTGGRQVLGGAAVSSVAVQSDGKIVAAGRTAGNAFSVERFNADGLLDGLFGSGGAATAVVGGGGATAVALGTDGKIVAGGTVGAGNTDYGLARFETATVLGPDALPPTATLDTTQPAPVAGAAVIEFTITYHDEQALDAASLAAAGVTVTGPDGVTRPATFAGFAGGNSLNSQVRYQVNAPGGSLGTEDNGSYVVTTVSPTGRDAAGNSAAPGQLGSFNVSLQNPVVNSKVGVQVTGALPAAVVGGSKGGVTVVVQNNTGAAVSGPVAIQLVASADQTVDAGDAVILTTTKAMKLKPGQSKAVKLKFAYPSPPEGAYFLLAKADLPGASADPTLSGEGAGASPVTIAPAFVDLTGAFAGGPVISGTKGSVPLTLTNLGNVAAKAGIIVRLVASTDQTIDSTDASVSVPVKLNLKAGASKTQVLKFTVPALAPGQYVIIASIDDANAVVEKNEGNNVVVGPTFNA